MGSRNFVVEFFSLFEMYQTSEMPKTPFSFYPCQFSNSYFSRVTGLINSINILTDSSQVQDRRSELKCWMIPFAFKLSETKNAFSFDFCYFQTQVSPILLMRFLPSNYRYNYLGEIGKSF